MQLQARSSRNFTMAEEEVHACYRCKEPIETTCVQVTKGCTQRKILLFRVTFAVRPVATSFTLSTFFVLRATTPFRRGGSTSGMVSRSALFRVPRKDVLEMRYLCSNHLHVVFPAVLERFIHEIWFFSKKSAPIAARRLQAPL